MEPLPMMTPTQALTRGFAAQQQPVAATGAHRSDLQARQGFRVGGLCLMVRYEDGSELTEMPQLYCLPNAPQWLPGIANLHGALTPVFDLANYLGLRHAIPGMPGSEARPMLLVLGHGGNAAGIVIDGLPQRLNWSGAHITEAATAPERLAGTVQRDVLIDGRLWFDLDCDALLEKLERSLNLNS